MEARPFAALRSMYATEFTNSTWPGSLCARKGRRPREDGIMAFKRAIVILRVAGCVPLSRDNNLLADMVFSAFSDGVEPASFPKK